MKVSGDPNRICVFCGHLPKAKTKEHVIPRWLIEMTGDPKRLASFGMDWLGSGNERRFAFDQLTAPACEECNRVFGRLEELVKPVLQRVMRERSISSAEASLMLDWFDKVRVGMWLTWWMLDKNAAGIDPHFHVVSRVGSKDRMLAIAHAGPVGTERLNFFGPGLLAFQFVPCCLVLRIKEYVFLNISADQLFSSRLGFPCIERGSIRPHGNGLFSAVYMPGAERIRVPLLRRLKLPQPGTAFFQPMIPEDYRGQRDSIWGTDYVRANCEDWENGIGRVFVASERQVRPLDAREPIPSAPLDWTSTRLFLNYSASACDGFLMLLDDERWIQGIPDERRRHAARIFKANKNIVRTYRGRLYDMVNEYASRYSA
jgi:hypothetical protein